MIASEKSHPHLSDYNQILFTNRFKVNSRTPAFAGISLALQGRGAFGATFGGLWCHLWVPLAPPLGAFGAMDAPYLGRWRRPGRGVSLAYAALGGDKKM